MSEYDITRFNKINKFGTLLLGYIYINIKIATNQKCVTD